MGMDATVEIWVGVRSEDCEIDEIKGKLPKALFDKDGCKPYFKGEIERVKKQYGCIVGKIQCGEEYAGLGVTVFEHDWDFGAAPFNMVLISERIRKARILLQKIFDNSNIKNKIGIWCQTDWR